MQVEAIKVDWTQMVKSLECRDQAHSGVIFLEQSDITYDLENKYNSVVGALG